MLFFRYIKALTYFFLSSSAGDTIPLLQYIIVKSNVENLVSELQFTKTMLGDNIDGELGYCFTSFEIALYSLDRIEVQ